MVCVPYHGRGVGVDVWRSRSGTSLRCWRWQVEQDVVYPAAQVSRHLATSAERARSLLWRLARLRGTEPCVAEKVSVVAVDVLAGVSTVPVCVICSGIEVASDYDRVLIVETCCVWSASVHAALC